MGLTTYMKKAVLDHVFGGTAYTPPVNLYAALFSVSPTDAGGGTELTGSNYSRVEVTNNTTNFTNATGTTDVEKTNGVQITFPTASGTWNVVAFGFYDASSGGNLLCWSPMFGSPFPYTAAVSGNLFTAPGSAYANNDTVRLALIPGDTLPGGFDTATTYYVRNVSGTTFNLSLTSGGAAITVASFGSGLIASVEPKSVLNGETCAIGSGGLVITSV